MHRATICSMKTPRRRITVEAGGERYVGIVYEGRRNWSAHVPRLPGLAVAGPYVRGVLDREQARRKLAERIEFHLEGLAIEAGALTACRAPPSTPTAWHRETRPRII